MEIIRRQRGLHSELKFCNFHTYKYSCTFAIYQARSQDFSWGGGGVRLGSEDTNL